MKMRSEFYISDWRTINPLFVNLYLYGSAHYQDLDFLFQFNFSHYSPLDMDNHLPDLVIYLSIRLLLIESIDVCWNEIRNPLIQ